MRERFEREATISALLGEKSIHVVKVRDYGVDDKEVPFYVMEFLEGESMSEIIKYHPLPLSRFLNLTRQICFGLEYNFGDDDDQATLVARPELAPFPDMPAEAPGILTEHEEINGVSPIQDTPAQSDEERAALSGGSRSRGRRTPCRPQRDRRFRSWSGTRGRYACRRGPAGCRNGTAGSRRRGRARCGS